jgi:hypothetical protein
MNAPSARSKSDRLILCFFVGIILLALWELTRSWHASILDRYEFRQLQTALSTYWMVHDGYHFDYLTPLFGPPWSVPMEFPTYQWCVAALTRVTGMPLEQSGRLASLLFFAATLPAVYDLLALAGLKSSRRLLALAVILSTPVYLFYARTFMIETAAVCFAVWFLCLLRRSLVTPQVGWTLAATLMAVLAALTKITTFVVFCPPAAIMAGWLLFGPGRPERAGPALPLRLLAAMVPVTVALALGYWWVLHGDAVKHSNPFTGFLTSTDLHQWNYGAPGLRFDPGFWRHAQETVFQFVLCEGGVALALLAVTLASRAARWTALACLTGFFTGPLLFTNLYHIHDYYYAANAILLTGAAGIVLASAWDNERMTPAARWTAMVVVVILQFLSFSRGYGTYHWRPAPPPPEIGTIIRECVPADGVVLIYGADWNPLLPYYSERRALMVPGERENETAVLEQILARLPPRKIAAMVTVGEKFRHRPDFIRERAARFGLSPRAFATGDDVDLYLPDVTIAQAGSRLADRHFATARILMSPPAVQLPADVKEQDLAAINFSMATPHPGHARSKFGVSIGTVDGHEVINAHAPSELFFTPPTGATHISAAVGLPAAAYAQPPPAATDGIDVEIFEQQPDGWRRSLYRRNLDPVARAADRGPQAIELDNGGPFTGQVVFSIGPGPAGNLTDDWAYWARIEIR